MKIKCIKNIIKNRRFNYNNDLSKYINIDDIYIVYGVVFWNSYIEYLVYNIDHIVYVPIEMFEVLDSETPPDWRIHNEGETIYNCPDLLMKDYFLERHGDHEELAREQFRILRERYEKLYGSVSE